MSLQIYNSLTRTKTAFSPIHPPQVKMYVCGPTVYDEPHIGHARSAYIFDVVRKYLAYKGYQVTFARNVTDVDDKIIDKARAEYKGEDLNLSFKKVAAKYLESYHRALQSLGIATGAPEIVEPRASRYIEKMIVFIQGLIAKGAAYQAGSDVYFDITKAEDYGKLSHQALEKMEAGSRVSPTDNKKDPLDFALWKSAKPEEPSWESPWGKGRPGWHIECSVMSQDILGDEFDIHGGGLDLIFPHHENEIAQSEGAGNKFARVWMHHGLLTINAQKMSKSLGNFITIEDILKKHHPDVLKLFYLQAHYSSPVDYTEKKMEEAKSAYKGLAFIFGHEALWGSPASELKAEEKSEIDSYVSMFEAAMDDNFNTPEALASLFKLVSHCNTMQANDQRTVNVHKLKYATNVLYALTKVLGLSIDRDDSFGDPRLLDSDLRNVILEARKDTKLIDKMVEDRTKLKKEKRFAEADAVRKDLESRGVVLEDKKDGTTGWRWK